MELKRILIAKAIGKVGEIVKLSGWVQNVRDHGSLIFIDLRDWTGVIQLVINPENKEAFEEAKKLGLEYVISITGKISERDEAVKNKNLPTGEIEIKVETLEILNTCKPLPFPLSEDGRDIDETLRLKYRFIDIRRKRIRDLIEKRDAMLKFTTDWFTSHEFTQVQTPLLTVSSPEGARDFLVPSRVFPGKFYALPQAPQQYKQLLMVGGLHRYFQIAPCFRDEDPRADRHYGTFYQIDTEFSFATQEEIFETVEPYFKEVVESLTKKTLKYYPFPQIVYSDAWDIYGSDKPDLRFEMKLTNLTDAFHKCEMNAFKEIESAKGILVDRDFTRKEIDEWTEKAKMQGSKGLAVFTVNEGVLESSLVKFFSEELQKSILDSFKNNGYEIKGVQTLFVIAGKKHDTDKQMGWLRAQMGDLMELKNPDEIALAWIIDFDMFEWIEAENKWDFMHNPFSMPKGGIEALKTQNPGEIKAQQYDLAGNGYELLSGSIRNHHPETFIEAFKVCGYTEEETRSKFGHMISAFEYGAPPHGGFAIGFDRFSMVMFDEENIREIYAFPMSGAQESMTGSPREVPQKSLDDLGILLKDKGTEIKSKICELLDANGMKYEVLQHEPVRTSEEAAKVRGTKLEDAAKTVVMQSKEYHSKLIMAVIPANEKADIQKIASLIGEDIQVAPADLVEKITGLKVGGIPPFGRLLGMEVYIDQKFWDKTEVVFNAGRLDTSIKMLAEDMIKIIEPNKISKTASLIL